MSGQSTKLAGDTFFSHCNVFIWYYYTPVRLFRIGCVKNNKCWKYKGEHTCIQHTYIHVLWQCSKIQLFWKVVLKYQGICLGFDIPLSPRVCLLGDRFEIPQIIKLSLITVSVVTAVHLTLRFWKDI